MTAERQNWNDKPDDVHEAYTKFKGALYDAQIYAERYERALNNAKAENHAQRTNLMGRAGWIELANKMLQQIYTSIR